MKSYTFAALLALTTTAQAEITRIEITSETPAFNGQSFGKVGAYVKLKGKAYGQVSPFHARNKGIQDITLAPRNKVGMVEYSTDIEILRPAKLENGNKTMLVEIHNRGRKLMIRNFNDNLAPNTSDLNNLTSAGDGFLMEQGYTVVWYGWQADVMAGDGRLTFSVPIAKNKDGSPLTGVIRTELTTLSPAKFLNLSSGWFTMMNHEAYPTASLNTAEATLTLRAKEQDPRIKIDNSLWSYGNCDALNATQICLQGGFQPGKLYELTYKAKDPRVTGLGFAVTRDLAAFLKHESKGNPAYIKGAKAILAGTSQSGRMLRTYLALGFNQDEKGRVAYEGALPHIGGGLMPLNVRFSQVGRAWGDQVDHLFPAYDFPFTYTRQHDPVTGRTQGLLDECKKSNTCPKIFHIATALEMWEGRQSLGLTDPLGRKDVADPANVRTFIMASTQHGPATYSPNTPLPFGVCQQQLNPNPQLHGMRALLTGLKEWVVENKTPPESAVPRISDGTLVNPQAVQLPPIPENTYGGVTRPATRNLRVHNPLYVLDYGKDYDASRSSGILQEPPKVGTQSYGVLLPQVDKDGNDVGGLRSVHLQAAIGTYTGWNLGRKERYEDGFCSLSGSFIPFAATKEERMKTGDTRLSLAERYPTKETFVAKVEAAAQDLVSKRYLLPQDAAALIKQAKAEGVRQGP